VAFSGGIDSSVLLHALANSGTDIPIVAVHVNHGLHPDAANWTEHCRRTAASLGVEFVDRSVVVKSDGGGLEAAARKARYGEMATLLCSEDCLLTAHHQSDQAETLLLNLMRGSGPAGLSGIGRIRTLGAGWLLRPMRDVPFADIRAYAIANDLVWIDDSSNTETRFDRNFLRQDILPQLSARWPAVVGRLARSAELMGEANAGLADLARIDLAQVGSCTRLNIAALQALPLARQRNLLRHAIRMASLPPVPATRLDQILGDLISARIDGRPLVSWDGAEVRRFRGEIFLLPEANDAPKNIPGFIHACSVPLSLGSGLGSLSAEATSGSGISPELLKCGLEVRFREGGESLRIDGSGGRRKLKKLLQESDVLPWMRRKLPLLFVDKQLVAVADLWVDIECCEQPGFKIKWHDAPPLK